MHVPSLTAAMGSLLVTLAALEPEPARDGDKHHVMSKILGGTDARNREFPFLLSVQLWGHHVCGAASLNPWWAVTAAHCVTEVGPEDVLSLRAGSVRREAGGHVHCVVTIRRHPRFGDHWYDHDIALLQVDKPFPTSSYLGLSEVPDWPPGTKATVLGWGVTKIINNPADNVDISFSNRLKKVDVQVVGNEVCRKKPVFFMIYPVTSRMMCAIAAGKDSTQGDSGGPLVVQQDNVTSLVGIVSWGEGRGHMDSPGVYTRVASYVKWINNTIKKRRLTRVKNVVRLSKCSASHTPQSNYSTHKVHVIPTRKRRNRRRRTRKL